MSFYRYEPDSDIHVVDCGGRVSLELGIERLRVLARELESRPPRDGVARLLIDFRETVWENASVHLELSRLTRTEFGLHPDNARLRAAIVNAGWAGQVAHNERWFLCDAAARQWLRGS
jgi:hypothetical protein